MSDSGHLATTVALGLLQGVTEFLPVSSSGHLAAIALLLGIPDMALPLIVLLHAATLLATTLVLRRELLDLAGASIRGVAQPGVFLDSPEGVMVRNLVLATLVTMATGLALSPISAAATQTGWVIGVCFLVTAVVLIGTRGRDGLDAQLHLGHALLVGLVQGMAVMPGLSRSGLTIACALALGMSGPAAFRFSFLLSVPSVAGAVLVTLASPGSIASLPPGAWAATALAFASGYVSLVALRSIVSRGRFWLFALYLIPLGLGMLGFDLLS